MLNRTTRTRGKNEGAVKIERGIMGEWANLDSQMMKFTRRPRERKRRIISERAHHPTAGAWLVVVSRRVEVGRGRLTSRLR